MSRQRWANCDWNISQEHNGDWNPGNVQIALLQDIRDRLDLMLDRLDYVGSSIVEEGKNVERKKTRSRRAGNGV